MAEKILKIGITGGIGSGKSTACQIFQTLGIPIYFADDRAKALMVEDENLVLEIKKLFGDDAYLPDGKLNRVFIAKTAFNDETLLGKLNAAVHPVVLNDANAWHLAQKNVPYTLKEAALLFESGSFKDLDKVVTVFAPEALRIERVVQRDGLSPAEVKTRIARQMSEEEKLRRADFVINNDGSQSLVTQIWKIHQELL
jgi:dephospho-CoA kinase